SGLPSHHAEGGLMSRLGSLGHQLYTGEVSYDFVGRRRLWYTISAVLLAVSVLSLAVRGRNLGIEFKGGDVVTIPTATGTVQDAREAAASVGATQIEVTEFKAESGRSLQVQTESLSSHDAQALATALADKFGVDPTNVTAQQISPSWGGEITKKALTGLAVFLVLIVLFLTLYFEWRMAIAAVIALLHDLVITVGIYALVGFSVTPATVIGVLTILGYSLYDTVVVFDKVRENTRGLAGSNRMTYSSAANLAVNQTLVRSINTSVIALLPVAAILIVGTAMGAGPLEDLSLALFVGIATGTYSSIFVATPLACQIKEHEPAMQALAKRVAAREAAGRGASATAAKRSGRPATATAETDSDPDANLDDELAGDVDVAEIDGVVNPGSTAAPTKSGTARPGTARPPSKGGSSKRRPSGKKRR
ncbi:MAG: protein translocase subunit SecF, partial [Actinomycetes bacterium]